MALDPSALLAGPRGRRVCLEYLRSSAERARGADEPTPEALSDPSDAASALWWAADRLDPAGAMVLNFGTSHAGPGAGPAVTPEDAAAILDALALAPPKAGDLRETLSVAVDYARYWQEPDGDDILAATPELRPALARAAAVIAASPHAAWWATPVDLDDQWAVPWEGGGTTYDLATVLREWRMGVVEEEARAARERPADPHARWSGTWWSTPPHALVSTSRSLPGGAPAGLWFEEDSLGPEEAVAVPVEAYPGHVIEIDGPQAWADLCGRHPLEVTASRQHDWFRTTGRDGRWVMPDWSKVATEADGVHLTVGGYLAAAGVAIDTGGGAASVIAGWNPDETYWFRGTLAQPAGQRRWVRPDDVWLRAG
jgi:hypothetical protein